jgi:hypothetical protein
MTTKNRFCETKKTDRLDFVSDHRMRHQTEYGIKRVVLGYASNISQTITGPVRKGDRPLFVLGKDLEKGNI